MSPAECNYPMDIFSNGNDFENQLRERLFEKVRSEVSSRSSIEICFGQDHIQTWFGLDASESRESSAWPFTVFEVKMPVKILAADVNEAVRTLFRQGNPWFVLCTGTIYKDTSQENHTFFIVHSNNIIRDLGKFLGHSAVRALNSLNVRVIKRITGGQADKVQRKCLLVLIACYVHCQLSRRSIQTPPNMDEWPTALGGGFLSVLDDKAPKEGNVKRIRMKQLEILKASKVINDYPKWVTSEERTPLATHTPDRDGERDVTAVVSPVDIVETIPPKCHNDEQNGSHENLTINESDQPHRKKLRFDNTEVREHNGSGDLDIDLVDNPNARVLDPNEHIIHIQKRAESGMGKP